MPMLKTLGFPMPSILKNYLRQLRSFLLFRTFARRRGVHYLGRGTLALAEGDNRADLLRATAGVSQPLITSVWGQLASTLRPTVVLDIGANYGEIFMSARYPEAKQIYVFEANSALTPFLKQSASTHHDGDRIRIIESLLSDSNTVVNFTVDEKWSGTSSAIGEISDHACRFKGPGREAFSSKQITCTTLDQFIDVETWGKDERLLFKLDVEGFEGRVLKHLLPLLSHTERFAGIVEFNWSFLERAGTPPEEVFRSLQMGNVVLKLNRNNALTKVSRVEELDDHNDLLIASPNVQTAFRLPLLARL